VLASTRARWAWVAVAVALLTLLRVFGNVALSWFGVAAIAALFSGFNYALHRVARDKPFQRWYAYANHGIGALLISAVIAAVGPGGHVLYAAYLIAPLQAALYLGARDAWVAMTLSLVGFGLATALRGAGGWGWGIMLQETLVLGLTNMALVPTLARIVARLRVARATLGRIAGGDLTARVSDPEVDELGQLGVSVNRTAEATAETVRQVQVQAQDLAAMAQQLAASSEELQASAQQISATTSALSHGTDRQRQLIEDGVTDAGAVTGVAEGLHNRAQEAERRIAEIAQKAQAHSVEIARSSQLLQTFVTQIDRVADAAAALEEGSREIGKLVDSMTRIASQTDLLALNAAIESARAGPHGLGFRVVADEVRKLSEQSGRAAEEVRLRVKATQDQITRLVAAMREGRATAAGVGEVSGSVRTALEAIFGDLSTTARFATTFALETETQTKRMREMAHRLAEVQTIAHGAAEGAQQTSAATEEQMASLGELTSTSQHLSQAAAKLTDTIRRFVVNGKG
jgi:methyl-accepting chemotaxis protein